MNHRLQQARILRDNARKLRILLNNNSSIADACEEGAMALEEQPSAVEGLEELKDVLRLIDQPESAHHERYRSGWAAAMDRIFKDIDDRLRILRGEND